MVPVRRPLSVAQPFKVTSCSWGKAFDGSDVYRLLDLAAALHEVIALARISLHDQSSCPLNLTALRQAREALTQDDERHA
jgi:hypothetical protein